MKHSIRTRLSLYFVLVTLICVSLISVMSNVILDRMFKEYKFHSQEERNKEIVYWLGQQFTRDNKWNVQLVENIGMNALEQGMVIKLIDSSSGIIWDASQHNEGMCKQMLDDMVEKMLEHYPDWDGKYIVTKYNISREGNNVGRVEIGYYGPFYYNDNDMFFISTLNKLLIGAGVLSLIFSLILGAFIARHFSIPITGSANASLEISKGYFKNRLSVKSSINEFDKLTSTINYLAATLEKQELLRKKLTTDVAHELRTPMSTLQSHIEAMIDGIWKPDEARLKRCHGEILRINKMVGDLEKLARYDSDNQKLELEKYDLSEQVRDVIANLEPKFIDKNISIRLNCENQYLIADKDKIGQVLVNLLSNALNYTHQGGEVEIFVIRLGDTVQLKVKDTGIGIGSEDLPHIFERFYRADKSRNRQTGGSGIGLTIVRAIIDAHGGNIEAYSELGLGTEFIVSFPNFRP